MKATRVIFLSSVIVLLAFGTNYLVTSAYLSKSHINQVDKSLRPTVNYSVDASNVSGVRFSSFSEFLPDIQLDDFRSYSNFTARVDHITIQPDLPFKSFPVEKMLSMISDKPRKIGDIDLNAPITRTNYLIKMTTMDGKQIIVRAANPGSNFIRTLDKLKPGVCYKFPTSLFLSEEALKSK